MSKENQNELNILIDRFLKEPTGNNLYSLFTSILHSGLQVPMNMIISDEDAETMKNSKTGDEIQLKQDLRFKPDWLKNPSNEKLYFPIFSSVEEATENYSKNFSWLELDIKSCLEFVNEKKDCSGLILNAFSKPIVIEGELLDILKNIIKHGE